LKQVRGVAGASDEGGRHDEIRDDKEKPMDPRAYDDQEEEHSEQEDEEKENSDREDKNEEEEEQDDEQEDEENYQEEEEQEDDDEDQEDEEKETKASAFIANYSEQLHKALMGDLDNNFPENVKVVRIFTSSTFTGNYFD